MTKFPVDFETLYRETGNPLYVFCALASYEECPDGTPLPAWIMDYLRAIAERMENLADEDPPSEAARKVNMMLGLTDRSYNAFAAYQQIAKEAAATHVYDLRKHLGREVWKSEDAKRWIANTKNVKTERTIGNWISHIRQLRKAQKRK